MTDKKFNRIFGAFIIIGMALSICAVTAIKLGQNSGGKALLILSAFASLMGAAGTVSSTTGRIWTFFFGFFDVSIYGIVCLINWYNGSSGLGNGLLHLLYFVPMQFIGFFQWKKRGISEGSVQARRLNAKQWGLCLLCFVALSAATYAVLAVFDKSGAQEFIKIAVLLDVLPVVCNIIGQFLMSTAYMEQWFFWIAVNISSLFMWGHAYGQNQDAFTLVYIIKYCFYLINSFNGLRIWWNRSAIKAQD